MAKKRVKKGATGAKDNMHRDVLKFENALLLKEHRIYKFGFWFFFFITLGSVLFSIWSISSIYENFRVVTKILDDAFERTNLVMDISSGKISACESELEECQSSAGSVSG